MAVDSGNILRVDLAEIHQEVKDRTHLKAGFLNLDPDTFAINANTKPLIHQFALEGAGIVADHAGYIKNSAQTGLDGLTYCADVDNPDPAPTNEFDKEIEQMGEKKVNPGEKLESSLMDFVLFEIEDIPSELNRYTLVQGYIKSALIHYILYKWFHLQSRPDLANPEFIEFENFKGKVRFNSVRNYRKAKNGRPYRQF